MTQLSPGSYRIVANGNGQMTATAPFGRLYQPGTPDREKAAAVTIGAGQHIERADFHIPELAPRIELRGRLSFSNGVPLPNQMVRFQVDGERYVEDGWTNAQGNFVIQVLAGRTGSLLGDIIVSPEQARRCPQFGLDPSSDVWLLKSRPHPVAGDRSIASIEVVFPFPSCEVWLEEQAKRQARLTRSRAR